MEIELTPAELAFIVGLSLNPCYTGMEIEPIAASVNVNAQAVLILVILEWR